MAMFNSYVELPEGKLLEISLFFLGKMMSHLLCSGLLPIVAGALYRQVAALNMLKATRALVAMTEY